MEEPLQSAEPLFTLTPRERALLVPAFEAIERGQQIISGAREDISRLLRMRAGRDDVMLDPATGGVFALPAQEPPGSANAGT